MFKQKIIYSIYLGKHKIMIKNFFYYKKMFFDLLVEMIISSSKKNKTKQHYKIKQIYSNNSNNTN